MEIPLHRIMVDNGKTSENRQQHEQSAWRTAQNRHELHQRLSDPARPRPRSASGRSDSPCQGNDIISSISVSCANALLFSIEPIEPGVLLFWQLESEWTLLTTFEKTLADAEMEQRMKKKSERICE